MGFILHGLTYIGFVHCSTNGKHVHCTIACHWCQFVTLALMIALELWLMARKRNSPLVILDTNGNQWILLETREFGSMATNQLVLNLLMQKENITNTFILYNQISGNDFLRYDKRTYVARVQQVCWIDFLSIFYRWLLVTLSTVKRNLPNNNSALSILWEYNPTIGPTPNVENIPT